MVSASPCKEVENATPITSVNRSHSDSVSAPAITA
jgi:hypothetical protein